jgi:predicted DNA-binding protein
MVKKTQINLKLPESELQILEYYAEKTGRTKTDILREFISSKPLKRLAIARFIYWCKFIPR